MKLIDLLVKMAKGQELPKKIKVFDEIFEYTDKVYIDKEGYTFEDYSFLDNLNDEVEVLDENEETETMKDKLLSIIDYYGVKAQLKYFQTEVFELSEAIINEMDDDFTYYEQVEKSHQKHIAEEIADVQVMLHQFQQAYNIKSEDIIEIMKYKINRQLERIESEQNGNI